MAILVVTMLLCEGVLRLVPSPVQYPSLHETEGSLVGIRLVPGARSDVVSSCFRSTVTVNSLGWRDRERTIAKEPGVIRIAVLGDSFTEGVAVLDYETFTRQMELSFAAQGERVEVLNFGLSSIGTIQEDILYEHIVSSYNPDIVLLAFYENDIMNNAPALDGGPLRRTILTYRQPDGSLVSYRDATSFSRLRQWLRVHSALFRFVKHFDRFVRSRSTITTPISLQPSTFPSEYLAFGPPPTSAWEAAWKETERTLLRLHQRMKSHQQFFFFIAPGVLEVARDPGTLLAQEYQADPPATFDVQYIQRRLQFFAREHEVRMIDLLPAFLAYRDSYNLKYPYFSFICDGHWSSLGHRIAAEALTAEMLPVVRAIRAEHDTP